MVEKQKQKTSKKMGCEITSRDGVFSFTNWIPQVIYETNLIFGYVFYHMCNSIYKTNVTPLSA